MQVGNDNVADDGGWGSLLRLQSEYQARLTEETLKYLRGLQAAFSPRTPGTVVQANGLRLTESGLPGGSVRLDIQVENRQRVHTPVSPSVTPLVSDEGATWYPVAELDPDAMIIGPGESKDLSVTLQLPNEIPPGVFRGSLVLRGFLVEGVPVEITIEGSTTETDSGSNEEAQP